MSSKCAARGGRERRDYRARVEREDVRPVKLSEDKLRKGNRTRRLNDEPKPNQPSAASSEQDTGDVFTGLDIQYSEYDALTRPVS
jgi:hypothetical protein